uniref:non-specific serine/threonine protein kinase n=1 Tax=Eptatretus burgeri TaxID=7764 RepID=A0A8C4RAA8_EPTBU
MDQREASAATTTRTTSLWKRLKQAFRWRKKRAKRRDHPEPVVKSRMNQSSGSLDADVDQREASAATTRTTSLWKRLKQAFRWRKKRAKRRDDPEPTVESRMNQSKGSQGADVNQPEASAATTKISFWKRLKQAFRWCKKRPKRRDHPETIVRSKFKRRKFYKAQLPGSINFVDYDIIENLKRGGIGFNEAFEKMKTVPSKEEYGWVEGSMTFMVDDWKIISKLGRGNFGIVFHATNLSTAKEAALKISLDSETQSQFLVEVEAMRKLDHPNIVKLFDVVESPQMVLVLEYVDGSSLLHSLNQFKKLWEQQAWPIMVQVTSAVHHIHSQKIMHRDIKLENVLYSSRGIVKIIDFGLAVIFTPGQIFYDACGTLEYMAPEMLKGEGYEGPASDVWSTGILFIKLFAGTEFSGWGAIFRCNLPTFVSKSLASLLAGMTRKDPVERLTMQEIMNHTWLNNYPVTPWKKDHSGVSKALGKQHPAAMESIRRESLHATAPHRHQKVVLAVKGQRAAPVSREQRAAPVSREQRSAPVSREQRAEPPQWPPKPRWR